MNHVTGGHVSSVLDVHKTLKFPQVSQRAQCSCPGGCEGSCPRGFQIMSLLLLIAAKATLHYEYRGGGTLQGCADAAVPHGTWSSSGCDEMENESRRPCDQPVFV